MCHRRIGGFVGRRANLNFPRCNKGLSQVTTYERYPSQQELQKHFEIVDGVLWRKARIRANRWRLDVLYKASKVSNRPVNDGYASVKCGKQILSYHVIVWILHHGTIPNGFVLDHIDGNRINNNINNLRLVTLQENSCNKKIHRTGRLVGCYFHKGAGRWVARARINGKRFYLGLYESEQKAHEVYQSFMKRNQLCHIAN